jgi:hypothetical protein
MTSAFEDRLRSYGVSIPRLIGWPDEDKFNKTLFSILTKARGANNRKIRAFGEMAALLWAQGNTGATVNLEHLWSKFCALIPK